MDDVAELEAAAASSNFVAISKISNMPQHPMSILHPAWAQKAEEGQWTAWYKENDHVFPQRA